MVNFVWTGWITVCEQKVVFSGKDNCLCAYLNLDEAITVGLLEKEWGEGSGLDWAKVKAISDSLAVSRIALLGSGSEALHNFIVCLASSCSCKHVLSQAKEGPRVVCLQFLPALCIGRPVQSGAKILQNWQLFVVEPAINGVIQDLWGCSVWILATWFYIFLFLSHQNSCTEVWCCCIPIFNTKAHLSLVECVVCFIWERRHFSKRHKWAFLLELIRTDWKRILPI